MREINKTPEAKIERPVSRVRKNNSFQSISSATARVLFLQRTIGNQAVQKLIKSGTLRTKLRIGQPGDKYEQEADKMAEQVMRMPEPQKVSSNNFRIQSACPRCEENELMRQPIKEEEEEEKLQKKPIEEEDEEKLRSQPEEDEEEEKFQAKEASGFNPEVNPGIENQIQSLKGGGSPLSENERAFFEPRFGADFSHVRVHTDTKAAEAARGVKARAFTIGHDVVFGKGEYAPATAGGRRLLGHELTHVVQQEGARTTQTIQRDCSDPDFCTPYPTAADAAAAESRIRSYYLPIEEAKFGSNSKALYESYLSRRPGDSLVPVEFNDPSSDIVASFAESWATADDQDKIIDLIGGRLSRAPGGPLREYTPTMMSVENFLSRSEMNNRPINYSNPLSIAGHIAGGIGSSDAGSDYRNVAWGNVTLEKVPLIGSVGYVSVETTLHYEVFDAIDFCPGDCGSPAEQLITVPMSRLEASGEAYDVPFKVTFVPESRSKRFYYS